jgi:hypothetical protein
MWMLFGGGWQIDDNSRVPVDGLTQWEERVRDAFAAGEKLDLRVAGARDAAAVIRGPMLSAMLLDADAFPAGRRRVMWVIGARIVGPFRLAFATVNHPVLLEDCEFEERPEFYWSTLGFTSFARSRLPGLMASNARIDGHLRLSGCEITDEIRLSGARIAGSLKLTGARLSTTSGTTLNAEQLTLGGDLSCRDAACRGTVYLFHARISGSADLDEVRLDTPGGVALGADSIVVDGGMFCRNSQVDGEVTLRHARIRDALTFSRSVLRDPGALALRLDRASIGGGVFLLNGFAAYGEVRAVSAQVGRTFRLNNAQLVAPGGVALRADAVVVDGTFDGRDGLRVSGELRIEDATINGPVWLEGAQLNNPDGDALSANGVEAASIFDCCDGFAAVGAVRLSGARIGSRLCFDAASLTATTGEALKCWRTRAAELTTRWAHPPDGAVDLRHAHIGVLRDDPETWPAVLHLDGLVYDILDPKTDVQKRLGWLAGDPDGPQRQPYEQLASVLRAHGNDDDARTILLARQRRLTRLARRPRRWWGYLQDITVGYGYRPLYATAWFAVLVAFGTTIFGLRHPVASTAAPSFNPFVYTLDLLIPLVDFGQQSAYTPTGAEQWLASGLIAAGLILATTVAAGLTRSLQRN